MSPPKVSKSSLREFLPTFFITVTFFGVLESILAVKIDLSYTEFHWVKSKKNTYNHIECSLIPHFRIFT